MLEFGNMFQTEYHEHTGGDGDGPQIDAKNGIKNSPQEALTPAVGGSLSSGGLTGLTSADSTILTNALARLADMETKLRKIGLLK